MKIREELRNTPKGIDGKISKEEAKKAFNTFIHCIKLNDDFLETHHEIIKPIEKGKTRLERLISRLLKDETQEFSKQSEVVEAQEKMNSLILEAINAKDESYKLGQYIKELKKAIQNFNDENKIQIITKLRTTGDDSY